MFRIPRDPASGCGARADAASSRQGAGHAGEPIKAPGERSADAGAGNRACRSWPLVAELFCEDAARDWQWEGVRVDGKLHLYCYLGDEVLRLPPFELEV